MAPEALAITLAAVNPSADGYLTAYAVGTEQPLAATLNYVAGQVTSTGAIMPINRSADVEEFIIYSRRDSHVVADVVGYFSRPQATALECTNLPGATTTLPANGVNFAQSPECPDTYTAMLGSCLILSPNAILVSHTLDPDTQRTTCVFRNSGGTPESFRAESQCCRIPGR